MVKPGWPANGSGWSKFDPIVSALVLRRVPIVLGLIFIAAGFFGIIRDHSHSARTIRRAQLLTEEEAVDRFARSLNATIGEEGKAAAAAQSAYDDAVAATVSRHRLTRDLPRAAAEAQREKGDVATLAASFERETALLREWLSDYEGRYGGGDTKRIRADVTSLAATHATEVRSWSAAVNEVIAATKPSTPSAKIDVRRVARNYADATAARTRAQEQGRIVQADLRPLIARVKDDLNARRQAYESATYY